MVEQIFVIGEDSLALQTALKARIINPEAQATAILSHKREITVQNQKDGREFQEVYRELIFAGGAVTEKPSIEGFNLKNVFSSKASRIRLRSGRRWT